MKKTKAELEKELSESYEEILQLRTKLRENRVSTEDYNRVEKKAQQLRESLSAEFEAFLECHNFTHAERRGVERYFAMRVDKALLDIICSHIPF
jgi:hypothetical protein